MVIDTMQTIPDIRTHFRPVQPTVKQSGQQVIYQETAPDQRLRSLIYYYWELKTTVDLKEPFRYRVVADGCIDIFFQSDNPSESFVMGFCKKHTDFSLERSFRYIGIRFLPAMFPILFGVDASEISNRFVNLGFVSKATSDFLRDNIQPKEDFQSVKSKLDSWFMKVWKDSARVLDPRVHHALNIILRNPGMINIEKDIDTGLSPRHLRRYFELYIGDTAKSFSQVIRFQKLLNARPSAQSLKKDKIYYDLGYYDQAHFIREFKNFYGQTPGRALAG